MQCESCILYLRLKRSPPSVPQALTSRLHVHVAWAKFRRSCLQSLRQSLHQNMPTRRHKVPAHGMNRGVCVLQSYVERVLARANMDPQDLHIKTIRVRDMLVQQVHDTVTNVAKRSNDPTRTRQRDWPKMTLFSKLDAGGNGDVFRGEVNGVNGKAIKVRTHATPAHAPAQRVSQLVDAMCL